MTDTRSLAFQVDVEVRILSLASYNTLQGKRLRLLARYENFSGLAGESLTSYETFSVLPPRLHKKVCLKSLNLV